MSSSPEAILYYGFPLPDYEYSDYSYHDINDAWEEKFRPKEPNDQSDYSTPEWDKWRESYKAWQASADNIKLAWSGAEDCEAYYVHAEGLKKYVDWGNQIEITPESLLVSEDFVQKLREFCEHNGIEWRQPGWHLAARYF